MISKDRMCFSKPQFEQEFSFPLRTQKAQEGASTCENPATVLPPGGKKLLKHSLNINHLLRPIDLSENCHLPDYVPIIRLADTVKSFIV